jgi:hypothetical protein
MSWFQLEQAIAFQHNPHSIDAVVFNAAAGVQQDEAY